MYASFMASGLVDLLGHAAGLPPGTELVRRRGEAAQGWAALLLVE